MRQQEKNDPNLICGEPLQMKASSLLTSQAPARNAAKPFMSPRNSATLQPRFGHAIMSMSAEGLTMGLGMGLGMRILNWAENTGLGHWVSRLFNR